MIHLQVFYVFAQEEPLWMLQCLLNFSENLVFTESWKRTTLCKIGQVKSLQQRALGRSINSPFLFNRWHRCHMKLETFDFRFALDVRNDIPSVSVTALSDPADFYQKHGIAPFVLRDAMKSWPALNQWTPEKLSKRFNSSAPETTLKVTHNLDLPRKSSEISMTFAEYFEYAKNQADETPLYVFEPCFGDKFPELLQDYHVESLKVFQEDYLKSAKKAMETVKGGKRLSNKVKGMSIKNRSPFHSDMRWLIIGPERSGAPWHTDPGKTSAWNALVHGRKRWAIYPPHHTPPGLGERYSNKNADDAYNNALSMTSLMWYLHVYPTLQPHEKPYEFIQEPGDVIYVPFGWWHLVLNLDLTIAVTHNFVDSHNLMAYLNDQELSLHSSHENGHLLRHLFRHFKPQADELFRIVQMPLYYGFSSNASYISSFSSIDHWCKALREIVKRHFVHTENQTNNKRSEFWRVSKTQLQALTSRVNPTFSIANRYLIKFYSHLNGQWTEIDIPTYLTPFPSNGRERNCKKRKIASENTLLEPYQIKYSMTLRNALEESFRIEKQTYHALRKNEKLQYLIPTYYDAGHLLDLSDADNYDLESSDSELASECEIDEKVSARYKNGSYWRWPYIVIRFEKELISLHQVLRKGGIEESCWRDTAHWIGATFLPTLHATPICSSWRGIYGHEKSTWQWYIHYLQRQLGRCYASHMISNVIPSHLLQSLESFMPTCSTQAITESLLPEKRDVHICSDADCPPVLLHGDLTVENILGRMEETKHQFINVHEIQPKSKASHIEMFESDQRWELSSASSSSSNDESPDTHTFARAFTSQTLQTHVGPQRWSPQLIIDFADTKTGDPLYDLIAVFFSALHCDPNLWTITLESAYFKQYFAHHATETRNNLSQRFLKLVLLHPSRSIENLFESFPQISVYPNWETIATEIFNPIWPGHVQ